MAKILLDYAFPITVVAPTAAASTAFLKQVCVVAKPKAGQTAGTFTACTAMSGVAALTDNTNAQQLFDAGMSKVYVLLADDLDVGAFLDANLNSFYTVVISDDFDDSEIPALTLGAFKGVTAVSTQSMVTAAAQAAIENRCCFFTSVANKAKNMFYAFGKLLSNQLDWANQQYISMPNNDDIATLGDANSLFDSKVSFVLHDDEFSNRLALFACGGKAITAPYIIKDLCINLQSRAVQWISGNQPKYTLKEAALLETRLQEDVVNSFIGKAWIDAGTVEILLQQSNFVATGNVDVSEPNALWRVVSELKQTL